MTQKYFELEIKPKKDYDVFLDLIESIVADAIEESENKSIIIRSEESLEDIKSAVVKFSEALNIYFIINTFFPRWSYIKTTYNNRFY